MTHLGREFLIYRDGGTSLVTVGRLTLCHGCCSCDIDALLGNDTSPSSLLITFFLKLDRASSRVSVASGEPM